MADLSLTHSAELMIVQVEGDTDAGVEFVDAFIWPELQAVDAGRIIVPASAADSLLADAREQGLSWEVEEGD